MLKENCLHFAQSLLSYFDRSGCALDGTQSYKSELLWLYQVKH
jgi:hypothetical protein